MIPHLFLWHCPLKGLCKQFKTWQLTPRGHEWLTGVWYPGETDSPGYDTSGRFFRKIQITQKNRKYLHPLLSGPGSLELWRKQFKRFVGQSLYLGSRKVRWLPRVWYLGRLTHRGMIPQEDSEKYEYLGQNETKFENFNLLVTGPGRFEWWKK